jgi:hypothetical protein
MMVGAANREAELASKVRGQPTKLFGEQKGLSTLLCWAWVTATIRN